MLMDEKEKQNLLNEEDFFFSKELVLDPDVKNTQQLHLSGENKTDEMTTTLPPRRAVDEITLDSVPVGKKEVSEKIEKSKKTHTWIIWLAVLALLGGAAWFFTQNIYGKQIASQIGRSAGSFYENTLKPLTKKKTKNIAFLQENYSVCLGDTLTVSYSIYPADADNQKAIIESSSENGLIKKGDNTFLAQIPGEYILTAYQDGIAYGVAHVTVTEIPVEKIIFSSDSYTVSVGEKIEIVALAFPENASDREIILLTGNSDVLKLEGNQITGLKEGTATLRAIASNGVMAESTVNVIPVLAKSISIETVEDLEEEQEAQLIINFVPFNTTNRAVQWKSSNTDVATVDPDGRLRAIRKGKTTITAIHEESGLSSELEVYVIPKQVKEIKLVSENDINRIAAGEKFYLKTEFYPEGTSSKLNWSSENPDIANVNNDGKVVGVTTGTTLIYAVSENGVSASYEVNVYVPVSHVKFSEERIILDLGRELIPEVIVEPDNATDPSYQLESTDPEILLVDGMIIRARAEGTVKLSATADEQTTFTYVSVVPVRAQEIKIEGKEFLIKGEDAQLKATVLPSDAADQRVSWYSENEYCVSINDEGMITANHAGKTNIIARHADGIKAVFSVEVISDSK